MYNSADDYIKVNIINPEAFNDLSSSSIEARIHNGNDTLNISLPFDFFVNTITSTDSLFEAEYVVKIKVFPTLAEHVFVEQIKEDPVVNIIHTSFSGLVYEIFLTITRDIEFFIENIENFEYYIVVSFFVRNSSSTNLSSAVLQRVYTYYNRTNKYYNDVVKYTTSKKSSYNVVRKVLEKSKFSCSMSHVLNRGRINKKIENRFKFVDHLFFQDRFAKCFEEIRMIEGNYSSVGFFMLHSGKQISYDIKESLNFLPFSKIPYGISINRDGSLFFNFNRYTTTAEHLYKFTSGYYGFYPQFINKVAFVSSLIGCEQSFSESEKDEFITPNIIIKNIRNEYHLIYFHFIGKEPYYRLIQKTKSNFTNFRRSIGEIDVSVFDVLAADYNKIIYDANKASSITDLKIAIITRSDNSIRKKYQSVFRGMNIHSFNDILMINNSSNQNINSAVPNLRSYSIAFGKQKVRGAGSGFVVFDGNKLLFSTYKSIVNSNFLLLNEDILGNFYEINRNFFLNLDHFYHNDYEAF